MAVARNVITALNVIFAVLIGLTFLEQSLPAQTDVNDVHVTPRESASGTSHSISLAGGNFLHTIKESVKLVLVPVSVTDPMERLVSGLGQENFQLFEGKKPQAIRAFSSEDVPVSVGIILDASGSMRDKMPRVREAVNQFCETANPQDEFFMVEFSDQPRLVRDFTTSPEDIEKELLYTQAKGRTSLLDAIYLGLHMMERAKYSKKALLIISDGGDNHSRYSERQIKAAAKESDVLIYSVGTFDRYMPTIEEVRGPSLLSEVAEATGGRAFVLESPVGLPTVVRHIGQELRTQYVIGYRPQDVPSDGKWHKIYVKLRLPKKFRSFRAHARSGYYANGE